MTQGVVGLIGRYAVFIDDVEKNESFGFRSMPVGTPYSGPYLNGTWPDGTFNSECSWPDSHVSLK